MRKVQIAQKEGFPSRISRRKLIAFALQKEHAVIGPFIAHISSKSEKKKEFTL